MNSSKYIDFKVEVIGTEVLLMIEVSNQTSKDREYYKNLCEFLTWGQKKKNDKDVQVIVKDFSGIHKFNYFINDYDIRFFEYTHDYNNVTCIFDFRDIDFPTCNDNTYFFKLKSKRLHFYSEFELFIHGGNCKELMRKAAENNIHRCIVILKNGVRSTIISFEQNLDFIIPKYR